MKNLSPYPAVEHQYLTAPFGQKSTAYVLCRVNEKPKQYFVRDFEYNPPRELWSALETRAYHFLHFYLAIDFMKFLESKPDALLGRIEIVSVKFIETRRSKPTQSRTPALQEPTESNSVLDWLTHYSGVSGEKKPQVFGYVPQERKLKSERKLL